MNKKSLFLFSLLAITPTIFGEQIKVLLLLALPASGKSETRKFISSLNPKETLENFGIGESIQIDDFPYVHIMRRITDEATKRNHEGVFFISPANSFRDPYEWGTLMHLINEDYEDIVEHKEIKTPKSYSRWIFKRIDKARKEANLQPILKKLPKKLYNEIADSLENDAKKLFESKLSEIHKAKNLKGKTIIIEFSRGGADCAPMPLGNPYGYQYSLSQLSPKLLENSKILYLWISPEESRRKNEARADPKDPGSILHHGVPRAVMYMEYGCDDIDWLIKNSDKPNTIKINAHDNIYYLPIGRFDNRIDQTTFIHKDQSLWEKTKIENLKNKLKEAFKSLV